MTAPPQIQLERLRPVPLKEQVVRQITRLIEEQAVGPGGQLPSERELSEQLGVSRGTVREAVQFLQALGVVEIRHGTGTFVRAGADAEGLRTEWRQWTRRHSARVHELLEVRKGLESFAAELAAQRASDEGLAAMAAALASMETTLETDPVAAAAWVQADVDFHHGLGTVAGNEALLELADALGDELLQERAATWDVPGRSERSLAEHRAIYEAIVARDVVRARESVFKHLESVEADIRLILAAPADADVADTSPVRPTTEGKGS